MDDVSQKRIEKEVAALETHLQPVSRAIGSAFTDKPDTGAVNAEIERIVGTADADLTYGMFALGNAVGMMVGQKLTEDRIHQLVDAVAHVTVRMPIDVCAEECDPAMDRIEAAAYPESLDDPVGHDLTGNHPDRLTHSVVCAHCMFRAHRYGRMVRHAMSEMYFAIEEVITPGQHPMGEIMKRVVELAHFQVRLMYPMAVRSL
jgi:hypothetical protein